MTKPLPASYLFVPATRIDRLGKAQASGAHAVIVDLEDAVSPADKDQARAALAAALPDVPQAVLVRVNGPDTAWFEADLAACRSANVAGIVVPKAERTEDLARVGVLLGADMPVLPLIETAQGMWNAHQLATVPAVQRLVFGSIDFQVDLNLEGEDDPLLYFRSQLVLVSRVAGVHSPVDGVTTSIHDPEQVRADTTRGRRLGFGAKLCIHPNQVAVVNACFQPGSEEIAWAERVLAAAAAAGGSAVAVDGKMVDKPVLLRAERIIARAQATEQH